jgi:metallophosphoesterase superfamily enzyme
MLLALLRDHRPQRLILVGDIMDGGASAEETLALLDRLREQVPLICVEGNHDRVGLRRGRTFVKSHREDGYLFEHGHLPLSEHSGVVITGHEHPSVRFRDGAGLQLRLPALIQEQTSPKTQRWILPAFSPWAAGGKYESAHERVGTWVCAPGRVWSAL